MALLSDATLAVAQTAPPSSVDPGIRFSAVGADTSPLLRFGGVGEAGALEAALHVQMQKVFADRLTPGDRRAPALVGRITYLEMQSYVGGLEFGGFGQQDQIEGDGVVTSGRQVLSSTHILTSLSPGYSGAYYTQGIDRIRLDSLAYQFAYWLRREMNI